MNKLEGVTACILSKLASTLNLGCMMEGRAVIQSNFDRLEQWTARCSAKSSTRGGIT